MDFMTVTKLFAQEFYAVPDYQRDYEWTNAQNTTLLDDLYTIVVDKSINNHFLGAIVTIPYEEGNAVNKVVDLDDYSIEKQSIKHVVDGQQRLTSISILIKAIYDSLDEESIDKTFKDNYLNMIRPLFQGSAYDNQGNPAPRLILNGNTGRCYNGEILKIKKEHYHKGYKGSKRMIVAYKTFKNEIAKKKMELIYDGTFSSEREYYKRLIEVAKQKILFVEIECDASSDAFQVFDSLNGKGLDLTAADRIKNVMMSWSPLGKGVQKWDALVQLVKEEYLASFFVSLFFYQDGKRVSKNKLPESFKNYYRESAQNDFDYFYNELKNDAIIYGQLRNNNTGNQNLNEILMDIQALRLDQVYVMLFAAAKRQGKAIFNSKEYLDFSKELLALIVRMQVCEKSMNKLDPIFSDYINMLKNQNASLKVVTSKIKEKKLLIAPDNQFKLDFAKFAPKDTKVEEFYVRNIENYRRKLEGNRSRIQRGLTIEHIIPQTMDDLTCWYGSIPVPEDIAEDFQDSVIENIGNKAILYVDDNASAGNRDYSYKQNVYKTGKRGQNEGTPVDTFQLIKDLLNNYPNRFIHEDVESRAKELAQYAAEIW